MLGDERNFQGQQHNWDWTQCELREHGRYTALAEWVLRPRMEQYKKNNSAKPYLMIQHWCFSTWTYFENYYTFYNINSCVTLHFFFFFYLKKDVISYGLKKGDAFGNTPNLNHKTADALHVQSAPSCLLFPPSSQSHIYWYCSATSLPNTLLPRFASSTLRPFAWLQPAFLICLRCIFLCYGFNSLVTFEPLTVSACSSALILLNFQGLRTAWSCLRFRECALRSPSAPHPLNANSTIWKPNAMIVFTKV